MAMYPDLQGVEKKDIAAIVIKTEYDICIKQKATYNDNKTRMYAVAYGQCSEVIQAKLKSDEDFAKAAAEYDVIKLLKIIKKISFHYQPQWYPYREFLNQKGIVKQYGENATYHPGLVDTSLKEAGFDLDDPSSISAEERSEVERDAKEVYLAWIFLSNTNKIKFALLLHNLANSHLCGNDKYPHTITAEHKLLVGWEGRTYTVHSPSNNGKAYTTVGEDPEEEEESEKEGNVVTLLSVTYVVVITSPICAPRKKDEKKKAGHMHITTDDALSYNKNERDKDYGDWGLVNVGGFIFHQHGAPVERSYKDALVQPTTPSTPPIPSIKWATGMSHLIQQLGIKGKIDPNWILLDSQSTVHVFCNAYLLVNTG
eukprot:10541916-Ditylum_brightwellii.AAC.1